MSLQQYFGAHLPPGQLASIESIEQNLTSILWGPWERQLFGHNALIAAASTDTGNTGYTHHLRAGLLLGRTTLNNYVIWDSAATDGSQIIAAVLLHSIAMDYAGSTSARWTGYVLQAGCVKAKGLIVPGQTTPGLSGQTLEFTIRKQLAGRILFDDDVLYDGTIGSKGVYAKTANYTVTTSDYGKRFTNAGAAGAVTFTLPATPYLDFEVAFRVVADQTVTVTSPSANVIAFNNVAATSLAFSSAGQKVGGELVFRGNGTKWEVVPHIYDGQAVTVA